MRRDVRVPIMTTDPRTRLRSPWRGILVPTAHEHHAALRAELGALVVHPVLAKWLHVRESAAQFEETAACLVALACAADPRLGVEPDARRRGAVRKIRKRRSRAS